VVGFAVASVVPLQAELETIAVAAEGQRRGVGRNLFAFLAGELAIAHAEELFLEVRASNRAALALYLSLGFKETGRRSRYYIDPVEDALLLALRLG
jgi:ribosomal-protein-alanine N-acetyltransferase